MTLAGALVTLRLLWAGPVVAAGSLGLAAVLVASPVKAAPQLETQVSTSRVEPGQPFEVELKAVVSDGEPPGSPTLAAPAGIDIQGPRLGTRREMSFVNGRFESRKGITATWTLVARGVGSYVIGPPRIEWDGKTYEGQVVQVQVVEPGTLPQRPRRARRRSMLDPFDIDPFDFFGGASPGRPGDRTDDLLGRPTVPEELVVDTASDPVAFLRATVSQKKAIVGEQVTYRVYAYGARGAFDEINPSEASRPKFLSHPIVENSYRQPRYGMDIDGTRFIAVKVREIALFPIETGKLSIGPMRMGFRGAGYPASAAHRGLVRHSEPLSVEVVEAPVDGRPPGYRSGAVGRFELSASVQPRAISQGEAVSVVVTIDGAGYPPNEVLLPDQTGVRWLPPETHEDLRMRGKRLGGVRKLSYVVPMDRAGELDLGTVSLPHFDADAGRYRIAQVALGTVTVSPSAPARAEDASPEPERASNLFALGTPRHQLRPLPDPSPHLADHRVYWISLLVGPLLITGGTAAARLGSRARRRRGRQSSSADARVRQALDAATMAIRKGESARAAVELERALYAAVEGATGVKARALLRSELPRTLAAAGLDAEFAARLAGLLDECERARFEGAVDGSDAARLLRTTKDAISELGKARTR
jgi:hypothetical protein